MYREFNSDVHVHEAMDPPTQHGRILGMIAAIVLFLSVAGYCNRRIVGDGVERIPVPGVGIVEDGTDTLRDAYSFATLENREYSTREYSSTAEGVMVPLCNDGTVAVQVPIEGMDNVWRNLCDSGFMKGR